MPIQRNLRSLFIILCLGYLIDFYDLSLFSVARIQILNDLNVPFDQIMSVSKLMFNAQALGIFLGGIISGVWGDKVSRISAVRIGILLYSTTIILNIFVKSIPLFAFCRFIAGIGLAGELSASIILLSELSNEKDNRAIISSIVYFFGVLGGIATTLIVSLYNWKTLFLVGGFAGFALFVLRKSFVESTLFLSLKQNNNISRGNLIKLLFDKFSLIKILNLIMCLVPFWLMVFFLNFAPEIAQGIGILKPVKLSVCLFLFFIGSLAGTVFFPFIGKKLRSHKKPVFISFFLMIISIIFLCSFGKNSASIFSLIYILVGFTTGYSGVYITLLVENFGTNQRSIGSTFIVNCSRSSLVAVNALVPFMINFSNNTFIGSVTSGAIVLLVSTLCLTFIKETYGISLDYVE